MKAKMFLFLILGILIATFAFAKGNEVFHEGHFDKKISESKLYVQPEQIYVNAEGLFIETKGILYQITQICQDETGFYVPYAEFWRRCPNGHPNPPWRLTCQVCNVPL